MTCIIFRLCRYKLEQLELKERNVLILIRLLTITRIRSKIWVTKDFFLNSLPRVILHTAVLSIRLILSITQPTGSTHRSGWTGPGWRWRRTWGSRSPGWGSAGSRGCWSPGGSGDRGLRGPGWGAACPRGCWRRGSGVCSWQAGSDGAGPPPGNPRGGSGAGARAEPRGPAVSPGREEEAARCRETSRRSELRWEERSRSCTESEEGSGAKLKNICNSVLSEPLCSDGEVLYKGVTPCSCTETRTHTQTHAQLHTCTRTHAHTHIVESWGVGWGVSSCSSLSSQHRERGVGRGSWDSVIGSESKPKTRPS